MVVFAVTFNPLVIHERVDNTEIKGIVANFHARVTFWLISKRLAPIIKIVDLHAPSLVNLGRPSYGCGQGVDDEFAVVRDHPMRPRAGLSKPGLAGFAWALPQGRVIHAVVNLIKVLGKFLLEFLERPDGLALRINALGDLSCMASDLSVAAKIMDELRVGGSKQSLADRTEAGLGRWPCFLGALIPRQQRFKIGAAELWATIDNNNLRQTVVAVDAFPQNHHAGPVAGCVEGEIKGQKSAGECVGHDGKPRPAQNPPRQRANQLNIQLRVIDVPDLEWTDAVARGRLFQFPIERLLFISGAATAPLQHLLKTRSFPNCATRAKPGFLCPL